MINSPSVVLLESPWLQFTVVEIDDMMYTQLQNIMMPPFLPLDQIHPLSPCTLAYLILS